MKKLLLVLAIGAFVASCNDGGSATDNKDSLTTAPAPATDSLPATTPDSGAVKVDSPAAAVDSLKK